MDALNRTTRNSRRKNGDSETRPARTYRDRFVVESGMVIAEREIVRVLDNGPRLRAEWVWEVRCPVCGHLDAVTGRRIKDWLALRRKPFCAGCSPPKVPKPKPAPSVLRLAYSARWV